MAEKKKKVRYINPPHILREKVGYGGIDPVLLKKGDEFLANNPIDFGPYALSFMEQLEGVVGQINSGKIEGKEAVYALMPPVMELKGNGAMFRYRLITEIAGIVLNFLENLSELNEDAFEIIDVHHKSLNIIITNKLAGDGGMEGRALAKELHQACCRYYDKYEIKPQGVAL